jgi:hypothetical protein
MTQMNDHLEALRKIGYTIFENLLPPEYIASLRKALEPYHRELRFGRNRFEGLHSQRTYGLLAKSPVFADLATWPTLLEICDRLLEPRYLLSAFFSNMIHPGEVRGPLHYDEGFYHIPRPRRAFVVSALWAIDEFTEQNGATEMIPGSHLWGDDRIPALDEPGAVPMVIPAGSVVVMLGTMWHRSGANRSSVPRIAINAEYCEPYLRQIENMSLLVPPEKAKQYSPRIQELLGYSIHSGFIGYVDGLHPRRLVDPEYGQHGMSEAGKAAAELLTRPGSWHVSGGYRAPAGSDLAGE